MRIYEITDNNENWLILKEINFDRYINDFNLIHQSYTAFHKVGHRNKYPTIISMIDKLTFRLDQFLSIKFPDKTDPDIISYQNTAISMKEQLEKLKRKLT